MVKHDQAIANDGKLKTSLPLPLRNETVADKLSLSVHRSTGLGEPSSRRSLCSVNTHLVDQPIGGIRGLVKSNGAGVTELDGRDADGGQAVSSPIGECGHHGAYRDRQGDEDLQVSFDHIPDALKHENVLLLASCGQGDGGAVGRTAASRSLTQEYAAPGALNRYADGEAR